MKTVLIAGGGTGGHIYPAVAIAQGIKRADPSVEVQFVGTKLGLETKIIPREGYKLHKISAAALNNVGLATKLMSLLLLPYGILQSIFLILRLRPIIVLGVGGYASGPMMIAAVLLCRRTAVFEPNAYPGLTNRWLSKFVDMAFLNFDVTKKFFKRAEVFGMPVRAGFEFHQASMKDHSKKLHVLIFGGSQGARGINETVLESFRRNPNWNQDFEMVHQIGARDWKKYESEYKSLQVKGVEYLEFLYDMPARYQWADLVVCRAGAATLSELASCQKASVLIPFPFAADNHQLKNAEAVEAQSGAKVIKQNKFSYDKFVETLHYFNKNREKLIELGTCMGTFHRTGASDRIARWILK